MTSGIKDGGSADRRLYSKSPIYRAPPATQSISSEGADNFFSTWLTLFCEWKFEPPQSVVDFTPCICRFPCLRPASIGLPGNTDTEPTTARLRHRICGTKLDAKTRLHKYTKFSPMSLISPPMASFARALLPFRPRLAFLYSRIDFAHNSRFHHFHYFSPVGTLAISLSSPTHRSSQSLFQLSTCFAFRQLLLRLYHVSILDISRPKPFVPPNSLQHTRSSYAVSRSQSCPLPSFSCSLFHFPPT